MRYRAYYVSDRDEDERVGMTADTAIVEDVPEAEFTGLLDANGNPLYRVRERVKFGFVKD